MNKTIKIVSTLLIAVMLIASLSQVCLASGTYTDIIGVIDENANGESSEIGGLKTTAAKVIKALRNISAIVAVLVITILGIKYMIGSTEERAEYKKSFIPLIVGVVVVVAAASIASALFSVAG